MKKELERIEELAQAESEKVKQFGAESTTYWKRDWPAKRLVGTK